MNFSGVNTAAINNEAIKVSTAEQFDPPARTMSRPFVDRTMTRLSLDPAARTMSRPFVDRTMTRVSIGSAPRTMSRAFVDRTMTRPLTDHTMKRTT